MVLGGWQVPRQEEEEGKEGQEEEVSDRLSWC
jgi:hypothetical protein